MRLCPFKQDNRPRHERNKQSSLCSLPAVMPETCTEIDREFGMPNYVQSTKSSKHTPPKSSRRQIYMSLWSHVSCVPVHCANSVLNASSLVVRTNDSEVVDPSQTSINCNITHPNRDVNSREDGELAFETFPGIYREEAIMLLRDFYMQTNQNGH